MSDPLQRNIRKTAHVFVLLLLMLLIYVSYIQIIQADFLAGHPLNRRNTEMAKRVARGQIMDHKGAKLSISIADNGNGYHRKYPYGAAFANITGYDSIKYGRAGVENTYNYYLSGIGSPEYRFGPLSRLWQPKAGNDLWLTLDAVIQDTAYRALGGYRGAVVVIAPKTGAILAMVSKPSFDPNRVEDIWEELNSQAGSPLLNRAMQGLYPPGSAIKTMVAETALTNKIANLKTQFSCEGEMQIGKDYTLTESNHQAHGKLDLKEALTVSCNITFGKLALELGRNRMAKMFEQYGFNKPLEAELPEMASQIPDFAKLTDGDLAQTGIGQGPLLVTPLRMAMLAASIANRGVMMKPFIVEKITSPEGSLIKQFTPEVWLSPSTAEISGSVADMMENVVDEGTGTAAYIKGARVAGKTGTAENPHGLPHAWFIGFAPADKPEVAIAVIVENAGSGGNVAAPIARQVFLQALR